jgi:micrococcal nuclease|tara:strand:- start:4279 stop:4695 length:417 start_codon:yes stop_codon:yes gene_type:complete
MYEYKCKVTRIIDGDTIDVNIDLGFDVVLYKQRIRLYGIDTPESRTRDKEEKVRGLLSKNYIKQHCPKGSTIKLISHEKGKFGRILGSLYVGDSEASINDIMVQEHYAVAYTGQSKDDIADAHLENKKKLIEKGVLDG